VELVRGRTLLDPDTLQEAGRRGSEVWASLELLLKGPELDLPDGHLFTDKEKVKRKNIRVRWWQHSQVRTLGDLIMPAPDANLKVPVVPGLLDTIPNYPADAPPVFFGHYWLSHGGPQQTFAPNVTCLDYSAGLQGPLTAYRWDGPGAFHPSHLVHFAH
jgi:hypothetical protein